jgi:hypothetical protein
MPPESYDDPTTVPAADIADNPYWKRDVRRSYPRLSVVSQGDAVGLLTVGSAAAPRHDVLQAGDAGQKQLVRVRKEGHEGGLAALFEKDTSSIGGVLNPGGLPPMPVAYGPSIASKKYEMGAEQAYPEEYVFSEMLSL